MSDDRIDSMPFSDYEAQRMEEPPCDWGCRPGTCNHAGTCTCGAVHAPPIPARCQVCGHPMKLRSVS